MREIEEIEVEKNDAYRGKYAEVKEKTLAMAIRSQRPESRRVRKKQLKMINLPEDQNQGERERLGGTGGRKKNDDTDDLV